MFMTKSFWNYGAATHPHVADQRLLADASSASHVIVYVAFRQVLVSRRLA
jgi:hypothetical protein